MASDEIDAITGENKLIMLIVKAVPKSNNPSIFMSFGVPFFYNFRRSINCISCAKRIRPASFLPCNTTDKINIAISLEEGRKYYYRNITFTGNYIHEDAVLLAKLGIEKGDVYDKEKLDKRLNYDPQKGDDVSSLYQDNGYLFFNIDTLYFVFFRLNLKCGLCGKNCAGWNSR